ncbi:methyl-accepting chemotaxis protein [Anaerosolibacter carboniphilus]|uniref:Methyl-accepting chemotaxis protein n=1 Tax=Anaerosolibacter carboniphilus TaxID=1417629 RepID=A0A841L0W9_9FIRM|nr:methyl-accepting chemotaxis protein [Anaerosolibacter carboniphilus]MBB6216015.1 methyl-accepting chemotaxis protein [Anaerosolibacter carboniphilus]
MKSIKIRIIVLVCCISILGLTISGIVGYYLASKNITKESLEKLQMASDKYGESINSWLLAQGKIVEEIGDSIVFHGQYDSSSLLDYLTNRTEANEYSIAVYLGFADNQFVSGDGWIPSEDYKCTERDWYKAAVNHKQLVYTAPYIDATTGQMVITIAKPIMQNDHVIGVLGSDIEVQKIVELIQGAKPFEDSYGFLLDQDKNIMIHPHKDFAPTSEGLVNISKVMDGKFVNILSDSGKIAVPTTDYDGHDRYFSSTVIPSAEWTVGFAIPVAEVEKSMNGLILGFIFALIISQAIALILTFFLGHSITKPIIALTRYAENVAHLDLRNDIDQRHIAMRDETGRLASAFQSIVESLRRISGQILDSAGHVAAASEQLIATSEQSAQASEQMASLAEEVAQNAELQLKEIMSTASAMENISVQIEEVSQNTNGINVLGNQVAKQSNVGKEEMQKVIAQMNRIYRSAEDVGKSLLGITGSSDKMNEITDVIKAIADQTSLLALNASIEAARAGEQGKGFAVVAGEVRKLAEESQKAAQEISELIHENRISIRAANSAMDTSSGDVKKGIEIVKTAEETFSDISLLIEKINQQIESTAVAVEQISLNSNHVVTAAGRIEKISTNVSGQIQSVSAATEEQSASMEEIASSSYSLGELAQGLKDTVKSFKL